MSDLQTVLEEREWFRVALVAAEAENDRLREALATAETRLFHCSNAVELLRGVEAEIVRLREADFHLRCALERAVGYLNVAAPDLGSGAEDTLKFARAALAKEAGK
jgi:uncharacterized protein with PIN domain